MTKELQALENIGLWGYQDSEGDLILCRINNKEDFAIIETALKELNEYKKVFEKLNLDISDAVDLENWIKLAQFHYENKIKKLKALDIIKKKEIDIHLFNISANCEHYNWLIENKKHQLTQEEYDLLKGVLL